MRLATLLIASIVTAAPALAQEAVKTRTFQRAALTPSEEADPSPAVQARGNVLLSEGFESSTSGQDPDGWTVIDVNNDTNSDGEALRWFAAEFAAGSERPHTGSKAAIVFWNPSQAADDWLITPGVELLANQDYKLDFWFKPGDVGFGTSESMEVFLGTDNTIAAMSTSLLDIDNEPAGDYQLRTVTFTASASGTHHIGFHCNSGADQYFCAIDDFELTAVAPVASITPGDFDFGTVEVGTTVSEEFSVTNTGNATLSDLVVSTTGDLAFDFGDASGFATTLEPGQSTSINVTFTPSAVGQVTGGVSFTSNAPDSPQTFTLTGTGNSTTSSSDDPEATVALGVPQPNPTAGAVQLDVQLAAATDVRVAIYDVLGREVVVLHDGPMAAGVTTLTGTTATLPAGSYLVRAASDSFSLTRSLTVTR